VIEANVELGNGRARTELAVGAREEGNQRGHVSV
jgi:hypothetical protein